MEKITLEEAYYKALDILNILSEDEVDYNEITNNANTIYNFVNQNSIFNDVNNGNRHLLEDLCEVIIKLHELSFKPSQQKTF